MNAKDGRQHTPEIRYEISIGTIILFQDLNIFENVI